VLLKEKGFCAKDMEKLASVVLASEEGREAAANMYAGPLHHLHLPSKEGGYQENDEAWLDMYAKVRYNCFDLDGSTLLPNMALFNHGCGPNAALVRVEPFTACVVAMVVIAKEGISCGQEIVQCYDSDLIFAPLHERRRQLMTTWNFMCKCDRCQADESIEASLEPNGNQTNAEEEDVTDDQLADLSASHLGNLDMYFRRQEAMHQPGLPFKLRRQMFSAQLAAACSLLPHLHPKLIDLYQQLEDLCEPSSHRDHCTRLGLFYETVRREGQATWEDEET
jgi:hypothetical protein